MRLRVKSISFAVSADAPVSAALLRCQCQSCSGRSTPSVCLAELAGSEGKKDTSKSGDSNGNDSVMYIYVLATLFKC